MKRNYIAPAIGVELYARTQSIAGCATKIGLLDSDCVINDPDATNTMKDLAWSSFFMAGNCLIEADGMDAMDTICYHTNAQAAFTS